MRWLLFLSRLALVCNVFFLLSISLQVSNRIPNPDVAALIAIIGYFLAGLVNPVVNVIYLLLFVFNRKRLQPVPGWLLFVNVIFLLLQFVYILYLNDMHRQLQFMNNS